jgi:hypothetical protein
MSIWPRNWPDTSRKLSRFMKTRSELTDLRPQGRGDTENAGKILSLGFPAVEPVLPSLFQWLETNGSPVELIMRPFFAHIGEPAFELVRRALRVQTKPALKCCLLRYVLPAWPPALVSRLEPELTAMVHNVDFHGLDVWALKLLIDKQIGDQSQWERWRAFKVSRLREHLSAFE